MTSNSVEPLRVMIVEDEAIILMQLEMILEENGHVVVGAAMSAEEAISLAATTEPELIIVDIQLQNGSSGLDVARAFRNNKHVTLLFITANTLKLDIDLNGAAAVVGKPFSDATMVASIAYLEECMHRPPPASNAPAGMRLSPWYSSHIERQRAVT